MNFVGQGAKVCANADMQEAAQVHTEASREKIAERLSKDRDQRHSSTSPTRDVFQRTASLIAALRKLGCGRALHETTLFTPTELHKNQMVQELQETYRRGYVLPQSLCAGRILFEYDHRGIAFLRFVYLLCLVFD